MDLNIPYWLKDIDNEKIRFFLKSVENDLGPIFFYFYNIFVPETNEDVLLLVKISNIFKFDLSEVYFQTYSKKTHIFKFEYDNVEALLSCRYMSESLKILNLDAKGLDMTINISGKKYFFAILNQYSLMYHLKVFILYPENLEIFLRDLVEKLKNINIYETNQEIMTDYIENDKNVLSVKLENESGKIVLNFKDSNKVFGIAYNGYSKYKIIEILDVVIYDLHNKKYFGNRYLTLQ